MSSGFKSGTKLPFASRTTMSLVMRSTRVRKSGPRWAGFCAGGADVAGAGVCGAWADRLATRATLRAAAQKPWVFKFIRPNYTSSDDGGDSLDGGEGFDPSPSAVPWRRPRRRRRRRREGAVETSGSTDDEPAETVGSADGLAPACAPSAWA